MDIFLTLILASILFILNTFSSSVRKLYLPFRLKDVFEATKKSLFHQKRVIDLLFPLLLAQNVLRLIIGGLLWRAAVESGVDLWPLLLLGFILILFLLAECLPRILANRTPSIWLEKTGTLVSYLLVPANLLAWVLKKLFGAQLDAINLEEPLAEAKKEIIDLIGEAKLSPDFTKADKQLVESVLTFKERICREVMVPRVDLFSLSSDTMIKEAALLIDKEGYSRIPIWKNSVDNIIGIVMYKDIIRKYMEFEASGNDPKILEAPIETICKNVLYTPETKKISNLLLEFRKKQSHIAIVVDEYGGTEGIVTIEDILEEIVGEIADEYDDEEDLYTSQGDGSFVVDARMTILDVDEELGVQIPEEGEYDTIGGYIFHTAGAIPPKGFTIHQDTFELEVIASDERRVKKVRLKPRK